MSIFLLKKRKFFFSWKGNSKCMWIFYWYFFVFMCLQPAQQIRSVYPVTKSQTLREKIKKKVKQPWCKSWYKYSSRLLLSCCTSCLQYQRFFFFLHFFFPIVLCLHYYLYFYTDFYKKKRIKQTPFIYVTVTFVHLHCTEYVTYFSCSFYYSLWNLFWN